MKTNHTEDQNSAIRDLQKRMAALERARPVSGSSISQGNLEVRTPAGGSVMRAGEIPFGSQTAYGMEVRRQSGGLQARFADTASGSGYWALFDEANHIVVSEDTASGEGLATPYLAYRVMPYSEVVTPPQSTVSATFEKLHRIHSQKMQPWVRTYLIVSTAAATTAEVILTQNGGQISTTLEVGAAVTGNFWLDAPVDGDHMSTLVVDVEARRTAGAGAVRVGVAIATGRQS